MQVCGGASLRCEFVLALSARSGTKSGSCLSHVTRQQHWHIHSCVVFLHVVHAAPSEFVVMESMLVFLCIPFTFTLLSSHHRLYWLINCYLSLLFPFLSFSSFFPIQTPCRLPFLSSPYLLFYSFHFSFLIFPIPSHSIPSLPFPSLPFSSLSFTC